VDTLQRSLCPPRLPQVAGFDVAVHYQPSSAQHVGGFFYDLFELATGRSGFFVGDVCATGPQAVAVASLARYTLRGAAAVHDAPAAVLLDLNAALRSSAGDAPQTCNAVYADIGVRSDAATISLALAGDLVPLIVRARGAVEATPARGRLLGAVDDPVLESCEIGLAAGDTIIIILGVTIDRMEVDEQRVAELLLGAPHASAQTLVDRLVRAVRRVDRPLRDDVAIIALRRTSN
jgi:phosphoserine phosphatase RsbU/P